MTRLQRLNEWFVDHPIYYWIVLAGSMGLVHLGFYRFLGRPHSWTLLILWVVIFPTIMAAINRARSKAERDA
jgi:hypothetical protein